MQWILKITIDKLSKKRWNVHANALFGGPAQILEYLGRYTHKTANNCPPHKRNNGYHNNLYLQGLCRWKKEKVDDAEQ